MLIPRSRPQARVRRGRDRHLISLTLLAAACAEGSHPAGPTPPPSALRYVDIDAGYFHTCALTMTGHAYCWGGNAFGTLGDGTLIDPTRPARVAVTTTFRELDSGAGHNCALSTSGSAWCWGQNDEAQLAGCGGLRLDGRIHLSDRRAIRMRTGLG